MWKQTLTAFVAVFLCLVLAGCAVMERAAESDTAVRAGTAEWINMDAQRADRVIEWADESLAALDQEAEITLASIQAEADKRIPWDRLSPGQRVLAEELLITVEARIADEIDAGVLSPDAVADIRHVLEVIRAQAERERRRAS